MHYIHIEPTVQKAEGDIFETKDDFKKETKDDRISKIQTEF